MLGIPTRTRGGTWLGALGEGQRKQKSLASSREDSITPTGEHGRTEAQESCASLPSNKGFSPHLWDVQAVLGTIALGTLPAQILSQALTEGGWQHWQSGTQVSHPHCDGPGIPRMSDIVLWVVGMALTCSAPTEQTELLDLQVPGHPWEGSVPRYRTGGGTVSPRSLCPGTPVLGFLYQTKSPNSLPAESALLINPSHDEEMWF